MSIGCKTRIVKFNDSRYTFNSSNSTFNGASNRVSGNSGMDYNIKTFAPNIPVELPNKVTDDNCGEVCQI